MHWCCVLRDKSHNLFNFPLPGEKKVGQPCGCLQSTHRKERAPRWEIAVVLGLSWVSYWCCHIFASRSTCEIYKSLFYMIHYYRNVHLKESLNQYQVLTKWWPFLWELWASELSQENWDLGNVTLNKSSLFSGSSSKSSCPHLQNKEGDLVILPSTLKYFLCQDLLCQISKSMGKELCYGIPLHLWIRSPKFNLLYLNSLICS